MNIIPAGIRSDSTGRVMAGRTRHPHMHARRMPLGRRLDLRPESRHPSAAARCARSPRSRRGRGRPGRLRRPAPASVFSKRGRPVGVGVAELNLHLGAAGDDRRRVRLEQHAADRPHRARAGDLGKPVVDARRQPHHRHPGILAPDHARRAGMVLLADQRDPEIPDADDRLDDADAQPGRVERVALLDMRFEIADIARRIDPLARPSGKPGALQRLAQRRPVVAARGSGRSRPRRARR